MKQMALLMALLITSASGDLMWQPTASQSAPDRGAVARNEATGERPRRTTTAATKKEIAYRALGQALATHPDMAEANRLDRMARRRYTAAIESGDPAEILRARRELAEAKDFRFETASAIPELKKLITVWQNAAEGPAPGTLHQVSTRSTNGRGPAGVIID